MSATKTKAKKSVYEIVTDEIIAKLEDGVVPWRKPWTADGVPSSMSSKKPYRGINTFILAIESMVKGYTSQYWGTYKQISALGGQVRKGESSTMIVFWKRYDRKLRADERTDDGPERKSSVLLRYFRVFNLEQADWAGGVPEKFQAKVHEHSPIEQAEAVLTDYFAAPGAPALDWGGDRAYYRPSNDQVGLPLRESFVSAEALYSTAFHEMTHSTGASKRLNREGVAQHHFFGDESYAAEELIAEMGAAMLCGISGVPNTLDSSASYIDNWIKVLQGDPNLVVSAAAKAQKAVDFILGTTFDNDNEESK